jgi:hypothetical protein
VRGGSCVPVGLLIGVSEVARELEGRAVLGGHLPCVIGEDRRHLDSVWHSKGMDRHGDLITAVWSTSRSDEKEAKSTEPDRVGC